MDNSSSSSTEAFEFQAAVEFEGFLIGVRYRSFAAYELDTNGMPKQLHKHLHELKGIFCPFLLPYEIYMGKCDGGRIWVLYTGKDLMESYSTRVAVFQVSISIDDAGNRLLSAKLEAAEFYFGLSEHSEDISSVFSICHDPAGSRSVEEKIMCGGIIDHDHP